MRHWIKLMSYVRNVNSFIRKHMIIRIVILVLSMQIATNAYAVTEKDCHAGIIAATNGDPASALMFWGAIPHKTYKQRVLDAAACLRIAHIVKTEYELVQWLNSAAFKGVAEAKLHLALWYLDKSQAYKIKAYKLVSEAVGAGHPDAYWILGMFCIKGIGTEINKKKGEALIHQAASLGSVYAASYLGEIQRSGLPPK